MGCDSQLNFLFNFSQALKKFLFLSKFEGEWPVEVVLHSYFINRRNYKRSNRKKVENTGWEEEFKRMEDQHSEEDDWMGH